jgi:RNA polymerase sigma factor (sigma-70 family)
VSTTITASLDHPAVAVRPGDQEAATQVEAWLQAYATSRDPRLRERIILAYLGLADRLASRFRDSRGTSPEDMRQTARAGLSVWAAPPPPASWPSSWSWAKRRSWRRWRWCPPAGSCRWDHPVGDDPDGRLDDLIAEPQAGEEPEDLLALPGLVARLPELEREVIVLRFFQDLDQDEMAARVGFSQMHVSRLQRRALARMRAQLIEP